MCPLLCERNFKTVPELTILEVDKSCHALWRLQTGLLGIRRDNCLVRKYLSWCCVTPCGVEMEWKGNHQQGKVKDLNVFTFRSFGGGGRIRTIETKRSRFTVCPLWPLGNSPILLSVLGAGRRTRTPDLLITNQLLYRLSYTGGSNRTRLL